MDQLVTDASHGSPRRLRAFVANLLRNPFGRLPNDLERPHHRERRLLVLGKRVEAHPGHKALCLLGGVADVLQEVQIRPRCHTGTTSRKIRLPICGLSESRSTRSTFTPRESLRSFSNSMKRNKLGISSKVTRTSRSLAGFSVPCRREPN